jgi:hypothetical protein
MANRDLQDRWSSYSEESRRWNPPLHDPTKINIPVSASARIRFEPNSRDAINSRIWESIQYDTKSPNTDDIQKASSPVYQDMNPQSARNSSNNYNQQPQFFPDPPRPTTKNGIAPRAAEPIQQPGLVQNPYLQRLDATHDARNIPREMRSAVYEDNREREVDASRLLSERQFSSRFLPEDQALKAASLQAYDLLRPKTDDYNKTYRS